MHLQRKIKAFFHLSYLSIIFVELQEGNRGTSSSCIFTRLPDQKKKTRDVLRYESSWLVVVRIQAENDVQVSSFSFVARRVQQHPPALQVSVPFFVICGPLLTTLAKIPSTVHTLNQTLLRHLDTHGVLSGVDGIFASTVPSDNQQHREYSVQTVQYCVHVASCRALLEVSIRIELSQQYAAAGVKMMRAT